MLSICTEGPDLVRPDSFIHPKNISSATMWLTAACYYPIPTTPLVPNRTPTDQKSRATNWKTTFRASSAPRWVPMTQFWPMGNRHMCLEKIKQEKLPKGTWLFSEFRPFFSLLPPLECECDASRSYLLSNNHLKDGQELKDKVQAACFSVCVTCGRSGQRSRPYTGYLITSGAAFASLCQQ